MNRQSFLTVSLIVNGLLVAFILLRSPNAKTKTRLSDMNNFSEQRNTFNLSFIPKHPVLSCNDLFTDSPANTFKMSENFDLLFEEFKSSVNASVGGRKGPVAGYFDGHSMLLPEQYKALHYIASLEFVRTICETGFNYGHSAFNFLTSNDNVVVHSFDLGSHPYTKYMADYLSAKFPKRFFIHYGDSRKSVPQFLQKRSDIICDFIFIDGSHTYYVAKSDLENFLKVAGNENIIVMDDYPSKGGRPPKYGQAWEELISRGKIKEIMRCKFREIVHKHTSEAAFVLGSAVSLPVSQDSTHSGSG